MENGGVRHDNAVRHDSGDVIIGLEVHCQLNKLASKLFCGCSTRHHESEPNTHTCPVCMGLPGALPVINKKAVEYTIMVGLALNCAIAEHTQFYRKNYYYPDLPRGFQITQYDYPIASGGTIAVEADGQERVVRIRRVHMEEDPGRLVHQGSIETSKFVLVDYNRSGMPLIEVVTEPDLRSPKEARRFINKLRNILEYLDVFDGSLPGALRVDANISLRGGARVEIKNISSYKGVERALLFEISRQQNMKRRGVKVTQETRHYDDERNCTITLRTKEQAEEYRYFPEPDLVPLSVHGWQRALAARLPELPDAKRERFKQQYGVSDNHARVLTAEIRVANYYEQVAAQVDPVQAATWVADTLKGELNYRDRDVRDAFGPDKMAYLLRQLKGGAITDKGAVALIRKLLDEGGDPREIIAREGLARAESDITRTAVAEVLHRPRGGQPAVEGAARMHLIITEKNITAKKIAQILFGRGYKETKVEGIPSYVADGTTIVGLSGHIVNIDFPEQYNNWSITEPRNLIRAPTEVRYTHKKIATALKRLAKDAALVTIATDFDREGELIGVEAYRIVREQNRDVPFDRVRFSAITKPEIERAFGGPVPLDFDLAAAGEARQKIDLVWGAALTRYISLTCGRLGKSFLSVGRVQTPLLALMVDRELEIRAFTPTPYWELYASLNDGEAFTVKHECNRFEDKKVAEKIKAKLGDTGTVAEYRAGSRQDNPPIPFSTTEFIRAAASIGFSAANAMRVAENLYVNGWISYPRTDNTVYPASLNLRDILGMLSAGEFGPYARKLLEGSITPTRGKRETTDHPPIYPVASARKADLREDEWRVYELVVRRFFATLAPAAAWSTQNVTVDISGEKFRASGSKLAQAGWRHYYPYGMPKEEPLPEVREGEVLKVNEVNLIEKTTMPPTRYGQGRLVKMMEDLGLGTKSTRHETIQKLYARNYVHGNPPQPTNMAVRVVEALEKYADLITKPDMTSKLEYDMDAIAEGQITEEAVVDESQGMLETIFTVLDKNHEEIRGVLYEGLREDKIIGKCQVCGSDLMVRKSK